MIRILIAALIVVTFAGCAVNTITINQYGPVQVSTGGSTSYTDK